MPNVAASTLGRRKHVSIVAFDEATLRSPIQYAIEEAAIEAGIVLVERKRHSIQQHQEVFVKRWACCSSKITRRSLESGVGQRFVVTYYIHSRRSKRKECREKKPKRTIRGALEIVGAESNAKFPQAKIHKHKMVVAYLV